MINSEFYVKFRRNGILNRAIVIALNWDAVKELLHITTEEQNTVTLTCVGTVAQHEQPRVVMQSAN